MKNKTTEQVEIDFRALFESAPGLFLILKPNTPNFTIMAVSNAYLKATMTEREGILGCNLFDIFPDNPNDNNATGTSNLVKSLNTVLNSKQAHKMDLQKYDIRRPESEGGEFEVRYWSPYNSPVFNKNNEVEYIIHRVEDVTEFVLKEKRTEEENRITQIESEKKSEFIKSNQERINAILEVLLKYTKLEFSKKVAISDARDDIDAIAVGLNTLSEEFKNHIKLLKNSEERYHNMVEEVEDYAIMLIDKNGIIQTWNKGAKKIKGYDSKEIIGKSIEIFYPINTPVEKMPKSHLAKAAEIGRSTDEGWRVKKDGSMFWAYVVYTALHDEKRNIIGFTKVTKDLTDLKEAENKLLRANKELEDFAEKIKMQNSLLSSTITSYKDILIFSIDTNYNYLVFNEAFRLATLDAYNTNVKIGLSVLDCITNENDREKAKNNCDKALKGKEHMTLEVYGDLTQYYFETRYSPIFDSYNNVIGVTVMSSNVTERKRAEEQLLELNKELESFSYSVSHDLRAPLRAIDGYAGILEEDYGKILDEEGNRLLSSIQHNAKKMGTLIDDLLAFSRLGKKELTKTKINMTELVEAALYEVNKSAKHNAKVVIKNLHPCKGDYGLLNQVVVNLLSNAIKYSSKVKEPYVEISSEQTDTEVIYFVKDNGAGFDMRYVQKLFGVFQRLHTIEEFEGTGVGLAIVQRIMNKHGGRVAAEGEKDKGAVFKFSLPKN